jgi:hypothetical protein
LLLAETDWGVFGATVALVLTTGGLVLATLSLVGEQRLTRRVLEATIDEARLARALNVRPHLGLDIEMVDPLFGEVAIKNLGQDSAFDVVLDIAFEPMGERRPWRAPTFAPDEVHLFHFPASVVGMRNAANAGLIVTVTGTYRDLYDESFTIDQSVDIAAWWGTVEAAEEQFPRALVVNALKKIAKAIRDRPERAGSG